MAWLQRGDFDPEEPVRSGGRRRFPIREELLSPWGVSFLRQLFWWLISSARTWPTIRRRSSLPMSQLFITNSLLLRKESNEISDWVHFSAARDRVVTTAM